MLFNVLVFKLILGRPSDNEFCNLGRKIICPWMCYGEHVLSPLCLEWRDGGYVKELLSEMFTWVRLFLVNLVCEFAKMTSKLWDTDKICYVMGMNVIPCRPKYDGNCRWKKSVKFYLKSETKNNGYGVRKTLFAFKQNTY